MSHEDDHAQGAGPSASRTGPSGQAGAAPPDPAHSTPIRPPPLPAPFVVPATIPGVVRRLRRIADLSQRQLAEHAKVSHATVARAEAGVLVPSLALLVRLLAVAQLRLVVTDTTGRVIHPMEVWDDTRDGGERQFPAHLDLILDPRSGEWWADIYGLARPPETYHRSRAWRDARRRRSEWEVRVKQFRGDPEPPDPDRDPRWWARFGRS